jgi:hypothetical protein
MDLLSPTLAQGNGRGGYSSLNWRHTHISVKKKILPGVTFAAVASWLDGGIALTVCRHGVLNERATNKSSV